MDHREVQAVQLSQASKVNEVVEEWVHQDLLAAKETREALDHQVQTAELEIQAKGVLQACLAEAVWGLPPVS